MKIIFICCIATNFQKENLHFIGTFSEFIKSALQKKNIISNVNGEKTKIILIEDSLAIQARWRETMLDAEIECYFHPFDLFQDCLQGKDLKDYRYILLDCYYHTKKYEHYNNIFRCHIEENLLKHGFDGKILLCSHFEFSHCLLEHHFKNFKYAVVPKAMINLLLLINTIGE